MDDSSGDYEAVTQEERLEHGDSKDSGLSSSFRLPEVVSYCLSSDLSTLLYCSSNVEKVLGCPLHQIRSNGSLFLRHIHSDDKFRVLNTLEESLISKQPLSVAYRWVNPDTGETTVLVNHCSSAFSDHGEVLSGVILHLNQQIAREINFVSGFNLPAEATSENLQGAHALLDEQLNPLSLLSPGDEGDKKSLKHRLSEILKSPNEKEVIYKLLEEIEDREGEEASEHLFEGNEVFLITIKKIIKNTFTPYFLLTLREVSQQFIEDEELRSFRRTRGGIVALNGLLKNFEKEIRKRDDGENSRSLRILSEIRKTIASHKTKPYMDGSELILTALNELSFQLPSRVEMSLEIPKQSFWVWASVANYIEIQLKQIGSWAIECGEALSKVKISLIHSGDSSFTLFLELTAPKKFRTDERLPSSPEEGFNRLPEVPPIHRISRTLVIHDEPQTKTYEVRLQSYGSFFQLPEQR